MKTRKTVIDMDAVERRVQGHLFLLAFISLVFGLIFAINPEFSMDMVVNITAIVLLVVGLLQIFSYIRADWDERISSSNLGVAFVAIAFGVFIFRNVDSIELMVTVIACILFFYHAGLYIQIALAELRLDMNQWWLYIVFFLVATIMGFVFLLKANEVNFDYVRFSGICMTILAIIDAISIIRLSNLSEAAELKVEEEDEGIF